MILPGPRARWCRLIAASLAFILLAAALVRPIRIVRDHGSDTIWLWAWQKGRVEFINSVTHLPVDISFGMPWRFSGFSVRTDPGTEEYYTAGGYSWNEQLSKERTRVLEYCSEVGINVTLGGYVFREQGGCARVYLLWPP